MSSSADPKSTKKNNSRVGPPVESQLLKELKANQRAAQEARTEALVADYKELEVLDEASDPPLVDLYEVGRVNVLNRDIEDYQELTSGDIAIIDLSESGGTWKGEYRSFGLVLTRGPGELLVISNTCCRPGEFHVKYDAPFPEEESDRNPE
jgi:hypothetical protein